MRMEVEGGFIDYRLNLLVFESLRTGVNSLQGVAAIGAASDLGGICPSQYPDRLRN